MTPPCGREDRSQGVSELTREELADGVQILTVPSCLLSVLIVT
jgi:hypothetical protein